LRASLNEARMSLSNRLWNTPWCVKANSYKDCLVISAVEGVMPPNRKTRKLKTWMGYRVVFDTAQQELFGDDTQV